MKILTFGASNSSASINQTLAVHAANVFTSNIKPDAEVEIIDLNDYEMPIYSTDRETSSGIPDEAKKFYEKIGTADALIISFAEYNASYTSAYKNILDWISRIDTKVYQDKPMVALSTSPSPYGGANVLKTVVDTAPFFGADIIGHLSVIEFEQNFDADGQSFKNLEMVKALHDVLTQLAYESKASTDQY